jgi:hypothetical protein
MLYAILRPRPASLAALLLAVALALCGCDGDGTGPLQYLAEADFSFVLDATGKVRLNVEVTNGTVMITGVADGNELRVDGVKQVWSSSQADADEYLDSLEVRADEVLNEFLVSTEQPEETGSRAYVVEYEIEVPDGLEVVIASGNGPITVASIRNDIVIASGNGQVTLDDIEASVVVAVGNGEIDADMTLPLDGTVALATGNGDISLAIPQSTSAEFSAEVGQGSIMVMNLTLQNEVSTGTTTTGTLGGGQGTIDLNAGVGVIAVTGF